MEEERGQERQLFYKIAVIVIILFIDQSHMADMCVCVCVCVCVRDRERGGIGRGLHLPNQ